MLFIAQKVAGYTHRQFGFHDSFASPLNEICDNVEVEPCRPQIEPLTNRGITTDEHVSAERSLM